MLRKHTMSLYIAAASLFYLAAYLFSYESSVLGAPELLQYAADFVLLLADMLLPMTVAAILLPSLCTLRTRSLLWRVLLLSTPQLLAALLDRYLVFIDGGYNTLESLLLGLAFALTELLIRALIYLLLLLLVRFIFRQREKKSQRPVTSDIPPSPFASMHPFLIGVAVCGAPQALLSLVNEVIGIIVFLRDYFATFSFAEVLLMTVSFLFIPFCFLLCLYLALKLCLYLLKA